MTDTVRIMPRQPIGAKRDEFGEGYYTERGTSIVHRDYLNSGGVGWVEVSDPIVWDGTDAMIAEVAAALPSPWECHKAFLLDQHLRIQLVNDFADLNVWVEPGWRIQIVGDSFAILPPEVTSRRARR